MNEVDAGRTASAWAWACLLAADPGEKCELTALAAAQIESGNFAPERAGEPVHSLPVPGRPERPPLVQPRALKSRGIGSLQGRAALLHAVAHIEFNAINLAWDAVYRFRDLPEEYARDWASVAADEARHFQLVRQRLNELGFDYGDFPAHNGLWEMALATEDCLTARMALVPRLLEARGLDVTPGMIEGLKGVADWPSVAVFELILREEVRHVAVGSRWFAYSCEREGLEPEAEFLRLLKSRAPGRVRPPFNESARRAAGFSATELENLQRAFAVVPA